MEQVITAVLSLLALLSSFCLWMLQQQRARPRLQAWWSGERVQGRGGYTASPDPNIVCETFETTVLVANLSALPDAVLDARCWVRSKAGAWLPLVVMRWHYSSKQMYPGFPVDVPPRQVVNMKLNLSLDVPRTCENYERDYLASPMHLKVELVGLGERAHHSELLMTPTT